MANNRMYLVFWPTNTAVFVGKRMGFGWYGAPEDLAQRVERLFDHAKDNTLGDNGDQWGVVLETDVGFRGVRETDERLLEINYRRDVETD